MNRVAIAAVFTTVLSAASVSQAEDSAGTSTASSMAVAPVAATVVAQTATTTEALNPNAPKINSEITYKRIPNRQLLAGGSTVFVLSYVPAIIGAAVSDRESDDNMYIPIAGPWMALARGDDETTGQKTLMVIDGIVQGIGALAIASAFFVPEQKTKKWLWSRSKLQIAPQVASNLFGLGAAGRF